jgi:hypothetical protein
MASFAVEAMGTQAIENLTTKQIGERLQQFKELTAFKSV